GEGQAVETSLLQGGLAWMTQIWKQASLPTEPLFAIWRHRDLVPTPCFEAADGKWFHPMINKTFVGMLADLGEDPRAFDMRVILLGDGPQREALYSALRALFRKKTRDEWVALLQRNDVPCQPIQPAELVFQHPQLRHTGAVKTVGPVHQLGHTYKLSKHD